MECTKGVFWHQHFLISILTLPCIYCWTVTKCKTKVLELPLRNLNNAKLVGNCRKLQLETTQVGHVKTGSCTAELWLIGITTEMCKRITGTVRDLPEIYEELHISMDLPS